MISMFVGLTDREWFDNLRSSPDLDEVNFWQPSGRHVFRALKPGGLFLFKLHSPWNVVVGGGFFSQFTQLPVSLAWDFFGPKNGAATLEEMIRRLVRYARSLRDAPAADREIQTIGCIVLEQPFFFDEPEWIAQPTGWSQNIVVGKSYDSTTGDGLALWNEVSSRILGSGLTFAEQSAARYGSQQFVFPRLGQGSFRAAVTDAYGRACAMTGDKVLHVLQAAHFRPYSNGGENKVPNGLLFRSDLHTLFDRGYLTVSSDYRVEVSSRLRDEFHNGNEYYALAGKSILLPNRLRDRPDRSLLAWHAENTYRAA